jgi:adenosylcobinamide kinase / adenosylcobinamide-phosphate guanylyltransferase
MIDASGSKEDCAPLPRLTVVLGGARSGKSALAERLAQATGKPLVYIATAEAWDEEMRGRIDEHQDTRGAGWTTVEAPMDLATALSQVPPGATVLVDCATLWLSNHLLAGHDLAVETQRLLGALEDCPSSVLVVSNETGMSIVPENRLAREFRDAQGRLNQRLAEKAGLVIAVWAGLPLILKGAAPAGLA